MDEILLKGKISAEMGKNQTYQNMEVIFVDDGSRDGTPDRVRAWEGCAPVRLVERREKSDLTGSILAGIALARGEVFVVMDADLSHPPEQLST